MKRSSRRVPNSDLAEAFERSMALARTGSANGAVTLAALGAAKRTSALSCALACLLTLGCSDGSDAALGRKDGPDAPTADGMSSTPTHSGDASASAAADDTSIGPSEGSTSANTPADSAEPSEPSALDAGAGDPSAVDAAAGGAAGLGTATEAGSPGGNSTPTEANVPACAGDSYDHDDDPSTACQSWTNCEAGQYQKDEGSSASDRVCADCSPGTYSAVTNASDCGAWTACGWTEIETVAPSASADRSCGPGSEYRQFPEGGSAISVAVDGQGNVLVGGSDGSARKYDPSGNELWTQIIQTHGAGNPEGTSVAVDSQDNVFVTSSVFNIDATFLTKYDPDGNELWTVQVEDDAGPPPKGSFLAVDSQDNVLVAGTNMIIPFVAKYDSDGNQVWIDDFNPGGPSTFAYGFAYAVAVDHEDNVVVVGEVSGKLPGAAEDVPGTMFVRKFDPDGTRLWTRQFGAESGFEEAHALALDSEGNVLVAGFTNWDGHSSSADAIVRKYDPDGGEIWTDLFETTHEKPGARALAVDGEGNVLLAGNSVLLGESTGGGVFVRKYDPDGSEIWTELDATDPDSIHAASAVTVDSRGRVFVAGFTFGGAAPGAGFVWLLPEPSPQ